MFYMGDCKRRLKRGEALLNEIIRMGWSFGSVIKIDRYDLRLPWKGYEDLTTAYIMGPRELFGKQYNKKHKII